MCPLLEIGCRQIPAYNFCALLAAMIGCALALPALLRTGLGLGRAIGDSGGDIHLQKLIIRRVFKN